MGDPTISFPPRHETPLKFEAASLAHTWEVPHPPALEEEDRGQLTVVMR